jgi:hypothetical protein
MDPHANDTAGEDNRASLELLKTNYQNLHSAYWKCHQFYWTMTSIFLPITLTAFAFVIKDVPKEQSLILILIWAVVFALLTYWWQAARYMHAWNTTRKEQLVLLEKFFNRSECLSDLKTSDKRRFTQYGLDYKRGFHGWTNRLYYILSVVTFIILLAKLFLTN